MKFPIVMSMIVPLILSTTDAYEERDPTQGYEALKGKSLLVQINEAPGLIVATFVLFTGDCQVLLPCPVACTLCLVLWHTLSA